MTTGLDAHSISLSRDGRKLSYSVFNFTANVYSIEIPETGPISVSKAVPLTSGNQIVEAIDVSYDGQWLVYCSDLQGNSDIYKMPITGGEAVQLTSHPSGNFSGGLAPDGEHIIFHSFRSGNRDIYCMTKDGGSIQQLTHDPSNELAPQWSADGSSVYFISDRTGRYELYVMPKKEQGWGKPEQLTSIGANFFSPISNSIVYISPESLEIVSLDDKQTRTLVPFQNTPSFPTPKFPVYSTDGKTVYYIAQDREGNRSIWSIPEEGGEPELKVVADDPHVLMGLFGFDTDGERFYFGVRVNESNVWVMDLISQE